MSLNPYAASGYSNYVYTGTAEVGVIVETHTRSIGTTNEDRAYDPANGKTIFYGNHCSEEIEFSFDGLTYGSTGFMAGVVGGLATLSTSIAIAGHAATSRTNVYTSINFSKDNAGAKAQRGTWAGISLPFASS